MSLHFTDEEFLEAWKELDKPQLEGGWEFFTETMGVKIYRLYDKETGLYEYKVLGVLATCTPELCADVYMDLPYRKQWDGYVKELHEKDYDGRSAIYWEVKYPFPLSNRDYVYVRERRDIDMDSRKIWVVLAKSSPQSPLPEKSGVQRVNDYKQTVAMESDGACGTKERSACLPYRHAEGLWQLLKLLPEEQEMNALCGKSHQSHKDCIFSAHRSIKSTLSV
ncbi:phosphatidylcholine transfer protein-like isoform X1 [Oncorhynchus masou masou]|uniref:phosphatidylcholine transfer protein-like isoform X1 n=1 Tax=Oncorhynchus masou masou TaxID=90313 RepID=UPI0031839CD2